MLVMFRISPAHWLKEENLNNLVEFFGKREGLVDELAFFTHHTHAPLTLEELERRFKRLESVMMVVRERLKVKAGINVLATMGHHEENLEGSLNAPWQRVMDEKGRVCKGTFCPADPRYREYVGALYSLAAKARPDFIWVDDDVRMAGHMPASKSCFCRRCVARFAEEAGRPFTRRTLLAALNGSATMDPLDIRKRWLEHHRTLIEELLATVEKAVHAVAPSLPIGFMTGDRFYEGYAFGRWANALAGPKGVEVRWRPGGGFYWDDRLLGLIEKGHDIGRQASALPPGVKVVQSEIENFPYQRLKKSVHTTMVEAAAHMAAGATGLAFNVLSMFAEPLDEYYPFLNDLQSARPFFERMRDLLGRSPPVGVCPAWNEDLFAANGRRGAWFDRPSITDALQRQYVLAEIGLPVCYGSGEALVTTFSGETPRAFSEEELKGFMGKGVFMDVAAWNSLDQMGLSHLTGVRPVAAIDRDATEVFADHPTNKACAGRRRDCRQSFWAEPAYRLEATADHVDVLAEMVDYLDRPLGPCLTAHENELGGRVAVAGYYPWFMIHNQAKSLQLKRIFDWLSFGRLPAVVESFDKVVMWVRRGRSGPAIVIVNASLDPVSRLVLRVRSRAESFQLASMRGRRATFGAGPGAHMGDRTLVIENLAPWDACLISPA